MKSLIKGLSKRAFLIKSRRFEKDIFSDDSLEDYQKWDLLKLLNVVHSQFAKPKELVCLDIGTSAIEAVKLSKFVKRVVGVNISDSYLQTDSTPNNVELVVMDGTDLRFPVDEFDFVYSVNLFEHINDLSKCIDEKLRVVKPEGLCFATWYPIWSSAKGHHIQEDMVCEWQKALALSDQGYRNDGTFIGDWDHLILSKDQLKNKLLSKFLNEKLVNCMVDFAYSSAELNRVFFDQILEIMKAKKLQVVQFTRQEEVPSRELQAKLQSLFPYSDFSTAGCQMLFRKIA